MPRKRKQGRAEPHPEFLNVYAIRFGYDHVSEFVYDYNYTQNVSIAADDAELIKEISNDITSLINSGIVINVSTPSYDYSKLPELKVTLLEKASNDARNRAISMLKPSHNRVGKISAVRMGVYQITPVDSTNVSDMGINDTSTIDKKVTAVANVTFRIK